MNVMRTAVMVMGCGLMGFGFGNMVAAQEPEATKPSVSQPTKPAEQKSAEQWIKDLGSDSYRIRLQAEKELRALGKTALPSLQEAAQRTEDSEIQWRAKRLVRQIESGQDGGLQERQPRASTPQSGDQDPPTGMRGWRGGINLPESVRERFDELFGQMERDFGVDVPRARFFDDSFFRDLQEQLQSGGATSQGMTMQMGPDGVRVEVKQKNDKGVVENKVYEAPDLETFQKHHPGVLEKNGLGMGMRFWVDGQRPFQSPLRAWRVDPWSGRDQRAVPRLRDPRDETAEETQEAPPPPPPEGKRLGVTIRPEIAEELREHLGLEADVGLMVESVQPGSLAESLGLLRGDIVVRIGDRSIGSAQDVQEALGPIEPNQRVEVRLLRKGVEKTASAVKPAPSSADGGR